MPDFKFACPECRKQVQCDVGYAGTRITCPICQKSIAVPSSTEPMIQIKVSTLKKTGLISGCVFLGAVLVITALHFLGGSKTVTFRAYVDGSDLLKLSDNRLWVEHLTWQQPTRMAIDGKPWNPIWTASQNAGSDATTDPATPAVLSSTSPYSLKRAFRPGNPDKIKVVKRLGRGTISITQMPKQGNENTLAILVDDGPMGGADIYELTVSW